MTTSSTLHPDLLPPDVAAHRLGYTSTIAWLRAAAKAKVPKVTIGRRVFFRVADLDAFITKQTKVTP